MPRGYWKKEEKKGEEKAKAESTPEQRFLTLLLYIDLPEQGGATSDPCVGTKV